MAAGAASVLVGGTIGEFYALSDAERVSLFASVRAAVPAPVPVIGHVGGVPADRAARWPARPAAAGLTALLALPPAGTDAAGFTTRPSRTPGTCPCWPTTCRRRER